MLTRNFYLFDYRIWITIVVSVILGCLLIGLSPFFTSKPLLMLAWPLASLFFIFMILQPKWVAVLILFLRPLLDNLLNLTKVDNGGGDGIGIGAIFNLSVVLLVIFLAFYTLNFPRNMPVRLWIIFLAFMLICCTYSPYTKDALRLCFNYLSYFALFVIPFLIIKSQEDFYFWVKVLAGSFVMPILFANFDMLKGGHYFEDAGMRIMGTFTHPNILAFYLVLAFTYYFYFLKAGFLNSNPVIKLLVQVLMVNILVLLIATKTRNAWIAVYAGFFIYGLLKERKILLFLLLIIPLSLSIPAVSHRVVDLVSGQEENDYRGVNSFEWRLQLWQGSLEKIAQRPMLGYGLASFEPSSEDLYAGAKDMHAHNAYLEVLFECGIIGLVSFISLFFGPMLIFFKNAFLTADQTEGRVWAIMVGYLVSYMFICSADNLSFYLTLNWYVWFFIGLMLVASYRNFSPKASL